MITGGVGQRDMGVRQVVVRMEPIERSRDSSAVERQFIGVFGLRDHIREEVLRSIGSSLRIQRFGEHIHGLHAMGPSRHHCARRIAISVTNVIERGAGTELVDSRTGDIVIAEDWLGRIQTSDGHFLSLRVIDGDGGCGLTGLIKEDRVGLRHPRLGVVGDDLHLRVRISCRDEGIVDTGVLQVRQIELRSPLFDRNGLLYHEVLRIRLTVWNTGLLVAVKDRYRFVGTDRRTA